MMLPFVMECMLDMVDWPLCLPQTGVPKAFPTISSATISNGLEAMAKSGGHPSKPFADHSDTSQKEG